MDNISGDEVGNRQAVWAVLQENHYSNAKELQMTTMQSGDDPDGFLHVAYGYRDRMEDVGQPVPNEPYQTMRGSLHPVARNAIIIRRIIGTQSAPCTSTISPARSPQTSSKAVALLLRSFGKVKAVERAA